LLIPRPQLCRTPRRPRPPRQKSRPNLIPSSRRVASAWIQAPNPASGQGCTPPIISEENESAPNEKLVLVMIGTVTAEKVTERICTPFRDRSSCPARVAWKRRHQKAIHGSRTERSPEGPDSLSAVEKRVPQSEAPKRERAARTQSQYFGSSDRIHVIPQFRGSSRGMPKAADRNPGLHMFFPGGVSTRRVVRRPIISIFLGTSGDIAFEPAARELLQFFRLGSISNCPDRATHGATGPANYEPKILW